MEHPVSVAVLVPFRVAAQADLAKFRVKDGEDRAVKTALAQ